MKRKKYIVGNWKMFKTCDVAYNDFSILQNNLDIYRSEQSQTKFHVGICAPAVFLQLLTDLNSNIHVYSQNVFWEKEGAFTGEISIPMLKSIHVDGSLIAHSERRQYFHETNIDAGKKIKALLANEMRAIYCVGESLHERESGQVESIIQRQLEEALEICKNEVNRSFEQLSHNSEENFLDCLPLSIAYEPVWAIGTGKAATVQDVLHVHSFIRTTVAKIFHPTLAKHLRILYGGSVKESNAKDLLSHDDVDGALVGGASLNSNEFFKICLSAVE